MSMTRRHYQIVAETIRAEYTTYDPAGPEALALRRLALHLAVHFERDNPRFDRERFMQAATRKEQ